MIPLFKPYIGTDTIKAAVDALNKTWLGMGNYVDLFEQKISDFLEIKNERKVIAVNTCTSALHLALLTAGVKNNDEVITSALNNIADFQVIKMCGAKPVFCDISNENFEININNLERLINPKTKAIIVLHYSGIPCNINDILKIANKHGIRVIEDAAHAIGTRVDEKMIGSYGDLTCFSFDAIKTITCIDGGAIIVNNQKEADELYPARLLGMTQKNKQLYSNKRDQHYDVYKQGFRYHLSNLHANIGLSQLEKLPEIISNRQRYCMYYNQLLHKCPDVNILINDYKNISPFIYVIRVSKNHRNDLMDYLKKNDIETGIHWLPGNKYNLFKKCSGSKNIPITDKIGSEIITLPLWSYMDKNTIEFITDKIYEFFKYKIV